LLVISTNGGVGDRDFIICSLDLISAFVDALEGGIESLVGGSNLLNLLHYCMQVFVTPLLLVLLVILLVIVIVMLWILIDWSFLAGSIVGL